MMTLPVDYESDDYQFLKTLNEDVQVLPVSPTANHWDIQMENDDYVNLTGKESLRNAICIAIMTRFNELDSIPLYEEFGCRAHQLIKANKSEMVKYEIELYISEVLENMRRIQEVNSLKVSDSDTCSYLVEFNVTSVNDETITGSVNI
ncbi:hypothetical protein [uncultured Methanobrevibacter sp.]|uniref:hypothetical protein n=1 Tax=uncultured Methanobrevibacter sp. TaxID=253161 RepID=UPI0025CCC521|nr:hypothetical protein [uncultured Methanobrevibacter sp.]